jgi:simple sugar transport system permease protein
MDNDQYGHMNNVIHYSLIDTAVTHWQLEQAVFDMSGTKTRFLVVERLALIFCSIGGAVFGALWALIPAILQAKRGSHIVITTIMFNFMAAALLNYLLVSILRPVTSMDPATASFPEPTHLPTLHDLLMPLGIQFSKSAPANISLLLALAAAVFVWVLIWRTRLGYALRAFGHSDTAAQYAGINPVKITILAMLISGGLAGMMAVNTTLGEAERLF